MKDSILVQTLMALSDQEMDLMPYFLQNPFFNKGSHANQNTALFNLLKKIILENDLEKLDKKFIYKNLLTGTSEKEDSRYLENRMSELLNVIRKFISSKEVDEQWNDAFEAIAMIRFYKERGATKLQERAISRAQKILDKKPFLNQENPILKYWLDEEIFALKSLRNERKGDLNISETVKSLTVFYAKKLLELSLSEVQQGRVDPEFDPTWNVMIKDMRKLFRINEFLNSPSLIILEAALNLIEDQTEEPLEQLNKYLELLNKHIKAIPIDNLKDLATYARNYCNLKINQGYRGFRALRLTMYKEHYEQGWLFENDKLLPGTFFNMINIGLWSGEKKWTRKLLDEAKSKLHGPNQEKSIYYGFALYHTYEKEYEKAREFLNKLFQTKKFGDMSLERLIRVLEIKVLYEEKDDFIFTQLHNLLMFTRRSERLFNKQSRQMHVAFIKVTKKMAKINLQNDSEKKSNNKKLRNEIKKIEAQLNTPLSPIVERLWLQEKVHEILD